MEIEEDHFLKDFWLSGVGLQVSSSETLKSFSNKEPKKPSQKISSPQKAISLKSHEAFFFAEYDLANDPWFPHSKASKKVKVNGPSVSAKKTTKKAAKINPKTHEGISAIIEETDEPKNVETPPPDFVMLNEKFEIGKSKYVLMVSEKAGSNENIFFNHPMQVDEEFHGEIDGLKNQEHKFVEIWKQGNQYESEFKKVVEPKLIPLEEYCQELKKQGKLNQKTVSFLLCQLMEGTNSLHQRGVVHNDIKEENVMIDGSLAWLCKVPQMKIIDYNSAATKDYEKDFAGICFEEITFIDFTTSSKNCPRKLWNQDFEYNPKIDVWSTKKLCESLVKELPEGDTFRKKWEGKFATEKESLDGEEESLERLIQEIKQEMRLL